MGFHPRHRRRDPGHELASAPSATICVISRDLRGDSQENKIDDCDDHKFRGEKSQIERINSINL
jgi:hypothetical protein